MKEIIKLYIGNKTPVNKFPTDDEIKFKRDKYDDDSIFAVYPYYIDIGEARHEAEIKKYEKAIAKYELDMQEWNEKKIKYEKSLKLWQDEQDTRKQTEEYKLYKRLRSKYGDHF